MKIKNSMNKITEGLSPSQLACLNAIKKEMRDRLLKYPEFFTAWNILRFCKARNFDVKKTKEMLTNYLDFRDRNDYARIKAIDHALFKPIMDNYAKGYFGYDYEGRLIIVDKVSQIYPQKIFGVVEEELITSCLVALYEHMMHIVFPILSKIHNRRIDKVFLICDLKDVSVLKFFDSKVMSFLKLFAQMASDFHPDVLGLQYIINTPFIFRGIWSVCKLWLDKVTTEKIFLESGSALDKLKKHMNINLLPVSLGGKCQDSYSIYQGPWKDEYLDAVSRRSFYLKDRSIEFEYFYTEEEKEEALKRMALSKPKSESVSFLTSTEIKNAQWDICELKESRTIENSLKISEIEREAVEVEDIEEEEQCNPQNDESSDVEAQDIPSLDNLDKFADKDKNVEAIQADYLRIQINQTDSANLEANANEIVENKKGFSESISPSESNQTEENGEVLPSANSKDSPLQQQIEAVNNGTPSEITVKIQNQSLETVYKDDSFKNDEFTDGLIQEIHCSPLERNDAEKLKTDSNFENHNTECKQDECSLENQTEGIQPIKSEVSYGQ